MDIGKIPQQSFIPRQPAGQVFIPGNRSHVNPLTVAAVIMFIISLALGGSVYAWVKSTDVKINNLATQITQINESFDQNTINLLSGTGNKINAAEGLLKAHNAPSLLLGFLETITLPTVSCSNLTYTFDGTSATVMLSGAAKNFTSLAAQSDTIISAPGVTNPSFSNFGLDPSGDVTFSLSFSLKPALLYYSSAVAVQNGTAPSANGGTP